MPFFGVPIRNGLPIGLGSVAGFGVQQFDPSQLFEGGTVAGAWYDPSDLSTMFDTSSGTTPVAMPGQGSAVSVGLMLDKSQGLVLGSELVTNGDFSSGAGWTLEAGWSISSGAAVGALTGAWIYSANNIAAISAGKLFRFEFTVVSLTAGGLRPFVFSSSPSATNYGNDVTTTGTFVQYIVAPAGSGYRIGLQGRSGGFSGTVDNISVRELPGNHAVAFNNTTARPELRARVNLLTYSEEFDNGAWTKVQSTISANAVVAPNGTLTGDKLIENTATTSHDTRQTVSVSAVSYVFSVYVQPAERTKVLIGDLNKNLFATFTLSGSGTVDSQTGGTGTIERIAGSSWYRVAISGISAAGSRPFGIRLLDASGADNYTGDGTSGLYIWGADLRPTNIGANVPAYQRIADANTYDTNGFPLYLRFDGIDDSMYTPANLNLSGTDKVAVFAGVRKLSDATQIINELSAVVDTNNGSYALGSITGSSNYFSALRGTALAYYTETTYAAPISNVHTTSYDIAGAAIAQEIIPRINGLTPTLAATGANAGTGNFGTYPLFIGARNNSSLFFNGHLHSLIIAGSAVSAGNISATEQWVAGRTGIQI